MCLAHDDRITIACLGFLQENDRLIHPRLELQLLFFKHVETERVNLCLEDSIFEEIGGVGIGVGVGVGVGVGGVGSSGRDHGVGLGGGRFGLELFLWSFQKHSVAAVKNFTAHCLQLL